MVKDLSVASDDSFDSGPSSLFSSLTDFQDLDKEQAETHSSLPHPAQYISPRKESTTSEKQQQKRSQVFRHHMKLTERQGVYSFATPPVSLPHVTRKSSLPVDYRSSVATLPYLPSDTDMNLKHDLMNQVPSPTAAALVENPGESSL